MEQWPLSQTSQFSLRQDITSLNCENILIAGDFNAITNPNKISMDNLFNIDAVNVKQIPNPQNSMILGEWIDNSFLIDIFRQLYPEHKVYSHIPFNRYLHAVISGT